MSEDIPPSFLQKPELHQEDDGNRLVFDCHLLASPKPEVAWFRGEKEVKEDQRTTVRVREISPNTYKVTLELDDVIESDGGLYKVKAKNKFGEVAASINLNFSREFRFVIRSVQTTKAGRPRMKKGKIVQFICQCARASYLRPMSV